MSEIQRLVEVMRRLRAPDGCPWDRKQTHESLKKNLLEEASEFLDAIDEADDAHMKEELGDLLFACANLSCFRKRASGEMLLAASSAKFKKRFQYIEKVLASSGRKFEDCKLEDLDKIWDEAKKSSC